MATEPKKRDWTVPGIIGIAVFVFAWVAWAISEYRPTAKGQITWEWISGICFGIFVGMIVYAFVATNRKS